jgi:hypothetical protein
MPNIRTNRKFATLPDTDLSRFAGKVIDGLTKNTQFPTPPVAVEDLTSAKTAFDQAVVKAVKGGSLATAKKNAARAALVDALTKDASYVDINCDEDLSLLLSSGYEPVSTNRAQRMLNAPQIIAVEPVQSGQLRARIKADPHSKSFVGRIKEAGGTEFGPSISFKNSRSILFKGLTAGVTYVLELMAVGGSTGQSDWSEPATKMAE